MANSSTTFPQLDELFQSHNSPTTVFEQLLPILGDQLQCDRCFLYLRNPNTQLGKAVACWRKRSSIPAILDPQWKPEPTNLAQDDPLFAAALRAEPSIFVEDVETASSTVVNRDFEAENFGHRALIHAHLRCDGVLWGILQPCVMNSPRVWTADDRALMAHVEAALTPLAIAYVTSADPASLNAPENL
ncbi:GAF domain-containing protein [Leptolyngbya sp. AN02str]|uniref:GAF domain-containing protein n=1 Tax=Leptolyngbya sp. AN02str TaxID=3423363 RepID=UPI003D31A883